MENPSCFRYEGKDAFLVLRGDICSTLSELQCLKKIDSFEFTNQDFLEKISQIHCVITLNTKLSQKLTFRVSFLERESEECLVKKDTALFEMVLINRKKATLDMIRDFLHEGVNQRFKGFILEDLALEILTGAVDINGIIRSVRHGQSFEDKRGKDFILEVMVKDKKFDFFFDLKSPGSFRLAKKKKRKKAKKIKKENKILISATSELLKNSPKVFLGRVYEHIINEYQRRFLDSSSGTKKSGTKKHPYTK